MQHSKIKTRLRKFFDAEVERVGFVLKNGRIVEVVNMCPTPEEGFDVSAEDLLKFEKKAIATWHTHPNGSANLSVGDYLSFLSWPEWDHYIVGSDLVQRYFVEDSEVLIG